LDGVWKEAVVALLRYCLRICLEKLRKIVKNLIRVSDILASTSTEYLTNTNPEHTVCAKNTVLKLTHLERACAFVDGA
jgi:hypothetical protein